MYAIIALISLVIGFLTLLFENIIFMTCELDKILTPINDS